MKARSTVVRPLSWDRPNTEVARKAGICDSVLAEARRLAERGDFGALLNQLVVRACELLDDVDETLVRLDPKRHSQDFAIAARLHRELERIQASIPARWRARHAWSRPAQDG
jgi:hypothetical protein